jgi:hypothetical protein
MLSPNFLSDAHIFIAGTPFLVYDVERNSVEPLNTANTPLNSAMSLARAATYDTDQAVLVGGTARSSTGQTTAAVYRCTPTACGSPVLLPVGGNVPTLVRLASGALVTSQSTPWALYRSVDDGASFQQLTVPADLDTKFLFEGAAGQLYIGGANLLGGVAGLYLSTDDGSSWTPRGIGTDLAYGARMMIYLPSGALLGTPYSVGPGIRCSRDTGVSWARRC